MTATMKWYGKARTGVEFLRFSARKEPAVKIVAWIFLLIILGTPILIAAWWLFPILAGMCVWALVKFGDAKYVGKIIKPVLLVLLFVFVVWLGFIFKRRWLPPSYENGFTANAIRTVAPPSDRSSQEN